MSDATFERSGNSRRGSDTEPSTPRRPLVPCLVAAAIGILVDRGWTIEFHVLLLLLILSLAIGCFAIVRRATGRVRFWPAWLAIAILFGTWHHMRWHQVNEDNLLRFANDQQAPCCLRAKLISEPVIRQRARRVFESSEEAMATTFTVEPLALRDAKSWQPVGGKCQVRVDGQVELPRPGSVLELYGQLARPSPSCNPGEFDYRVYLRTSGIHTTLQLRSSESISVIEVASLNARSIRASIRQIISRRIQQLFVPKHAAALEAMLLGRREQLTEQQKDKYARTGTSHLLALSGLHLSIIAGPCLLVGRFGIWRMSTAFVVAILCSFAYCWLVEFKPPLVRATVLLTVIGTAKLLSRKPQLENTLSLAGLVVLAINPSHLFSVGTQLSFLAVLSITQLSRRLKLFGRSDEPLQQLINESRSPFARTLRRGFRNSFEGLLVCFWVWLITTPLAASRFHVVAWGTAIVNLVVLPVLATVMYSTLLALAISPWFSSGADFVATPARLGLLWIDLILELSESVPHSWQWTAGPRTWWLVVAYSSYVSLSILRSPVRFQLATRLAIGVVIVLLTQPLWGLALPSRCLRSRPLEVTFLDVGHGTCVLVRLPSGENLLYDAGGMGGGQFVARRISSALWHYGIEHLELVMISHADADHFNALEELSTRIDIKTIVVEPSMIDSSDVMWEQTKARLQRTDIKVNAAQQGDEIDLASSSDSKGAQEVRLGIEHPPAGLTIASDNAKSLVLRIEQAGSSILLAGDLEGNQLDRWIAAANRADVMLAPHHGSGLIPISSLITKTRPQIVVISGGWTSRSEEVAKRYAELDATVLHTARVGAVRVRPSESGLQVESWRPSLPSGGNSAEDRDSSSARVTKRYPFWFPPALRTWH